MSLRPHQQIALDNLRAAYRAGHRAPVLVMATGGGKTHTAAEIIRSAITRGNRVWFLAHLREILDATSRKLTAEGIGHGHIMAGLESDPDAMVQVVMVQTAVRRLGKYRKPDLIVIDEAHLAVADTYTKVIADCGHPRLLLLTATPIRLDGRGLREVADVLVQSCSTAELIADGLLAPIRYYAPSQPDLTGVRSIGGDYATGELADAMQRSTVTGDAVAHYRKLAHGRPAVAFCVSIKHAETTAAEFTAAGYRATAISGNSTTAERDAALQGLQAGNLDVVVNCALWVAGVDCPAIGCVILLAPTKSVTKYLQSIGRGLRTHPGKSDLIVLDHAGNVMRHGLPTDQREWSLDGAKKRSRQQDDVEAVRQCEMCFACYPPQPICPQCGHAHPVKPRKLEVVDGDLQEITEIKRKQRLEVGRARTVEALTKIAAERGYKSGWVWQQMRVRASR